MPSPSAYSQSTPSVLNASKQQHYVDSKLNLSNNEVIAVNNTITQIKKYKINTIIKNMPVNLFLNLSIEARKSLWEKSSPENKKLLWERLIKNKNTEKAQEEILNRIIPTSSEKFKKLFEEYRYKNFSMFEFDIGQSIFYKLKNERLNLNDFGISSYRFNQIPGMHDERILDFNKKLIELLYNERYNNFGWKGIIEDKKENGETIEIPPPALPPSYSEATAIQRKRPSSSVEELIPSKQAKQANPETLLALRKYLNEKKLGRQPLN